MSGRICKFRHGIILPIPNYSIVGMELFYKNLPQVYRKFIKDSEDPMNFQGEIFVGMRTTDDEHVYKVLRSNVSEDKFRESPADWIYDALHACAESDWWYRHEKRYSDKLMVMLVFVASFFLAHLVSWAGDDFRIVGKGYDLVLRGTEIVTVKHQDRIPDLPVRKIRIRPKYAGVIPQP